MSGTAYRFSSAWLLPGRPDRVFDLLADIEGYPRWWPQVRSATGLGAGRVHVVVRSGLPYSLALELVRAVEDPAAGVLEARIHGVLEGWSRWTVEGLGDRTSVRYEQEVVTSGRLLSSASRIVRPLLVANHAWMMRQGHAGLVRAVRAGGGTTAR